jgi:acetoin utilization deacetylase AcuC-like enzyme
MSVGLVLDEVFLTHRPHDVHPERPERLLAVGKALADAGLVERSERLPVRSATDEELGRVHDPALLSLLERELPGKSGYLDGDTYFSPGSWAAARAAAAAAVDLAEASVSGRAPRGLAVVRPPGHHATPTRSMGFCIFNNVAVAARAARAAGCARVAVLDWDVHHGNGTQDAFYADPSVLYLSTHQWPFYPGSGASDEIGEGAGKGSTVNVPLPAGSGDAEYEAAFDELIVPALRAFAPDLLLCSAGYDAFVDDPLAGMRVSLEGFRRLATRARAVADEVAGGRMVCVLEGGYDLGGVAGGALATFEVLASPEIPAAASLPAREIHPGARRAIEATKRALGPFLPGLDRDMSVRS